MSSVKRVIALLIIAAFCFADLSGLVVMAADDGVKASIDVVFDGNTYHEDVIVVDDTVLMSAEKLAHYANYEFVYYNYNTWAFRRKGQDDYMKAYKYAILTPEEKLLSLEGEYSNEIKLSHVVENDGTYYLPIDQVLPCLGVKAEVKDGQLHIYYAGITMVDAMYGITSNFKYKYLFNFADEFDSRVGAATFYLLPAYLLNMFTDIAGTLEITGTLGEVGRYEDAFTSMLMNDDEYLQAIGGSSDYREALVNIADEAVPFIGTVYDIGESIELISGQKINVGNSVYTLEDLEFVQYAEPIYDHVRYFYNYANYVQDNYDMIDVVYGSVYNNGVGHAIDAISSDRTYEKLAAGKVMASYKKEFMGAAVGTVFTTLKSIKDSAVDLALIEAELTAKLSSAAVNYLLDMKIDRIPLLVNYMNIMYSAKAAFDSYRKLQQTEDYIRGERLSYLLCLMASRECYSVMRDQCNDRQLRNSYQSSIDEITGRIVLLYQAAGKEIYDSIGFIREETETLGKELKELASVLTTVATTTTATTTTTEARRKVSNILVDSNCFYTDSGTYDYIQVDAYDSKGNIVWSFYDEYEVTDQFYGRGAYIWGDRFVILITQCDRLVALDYQTGEKVWTYREYIGESIRLRAQDNRLYVSGVYGVDCMALNTSGKSIWKYESEIFDGYSAEGIALGSNGICIEFYDMYGAGVIGEETISYSGEYIDHTIYADDDNSSYEDDSSYEDVLSGECILSGWLTVDVEFYFLELDQAISYYDPNTECIVTNDVIWIYRDYETDLALENYVDGWVTLEGTLFDYRGGGTTLMFEDTPYVVDAN